MSNQIFKTGVPSSLLFELLEKISQKSEKCYTVNNNSYKKGIFTKDISNFLEDLWRHITWRATLLIEQLVFRSLNGKSKVSYLNLIELSILY